jgi:hypothetical protein
MASTTFDKPLDTEVDSLREQIGTLNRNIKAYKKDASTLDGLKADLVSFATGLSLNDVRPYAFWASATFTPFDVGNVYNGDVRILDTGTKLSFVVCFADFYSNIISVAYRRGDWYIKKVAMN